MNNAPEQYPVGFSMALAQNVYAMQEFAEMPPQQREAIVQRARAAHSREEMESIVSSIIRH